MKTVSLKRLKYCLQGVLSAILLTSTLHADWTSWRGKDGLGISDENNWVPEKLAASKLWETNVGVGWSAVASINNHIYTMGNVDGKDIVYCLEKKDASVVWKYEFDQEAGNFPGPRSTPVIDDDRLYTISRDAVIYCFNRNSGSVVWQRNLKQEHDLGIPRWGVSGSPVIYKDKLVLNVGKHGGLFDKMTGETIWISSGDNCGYATPVIYENDGKKCLAIGGADHIYGVDLESGKELWSHFFQNRWDINASDPLVYNKNVFVSANYGTGTVLLDISQQEAKQVWENKELQIYFCSPIYLDGYIYACDGHVNKDKKCQLLCMDAATGDIVWSVNKGFNSIIIADGKIIALSQGGVVTVAEASPTEYHEIASAKVINSSRKTPVWTAPVLDNGLLFCRNAAGDLVCLDLNKS